MSRESIHNETTKVLQWKRDMEQKNHDLECDLRQKELQLQSSMTQLQEINADLGALQRQFKDELEEKVSLEGKTKGIMEGVNELESEMNLLNNSHLLQKKCILLINSRIDHFKMVLKELERQCSSFELDHTSNQNSYSSKVKYLETQIQDFELQIQKVSLENKTRERKTQTRIATQDKSIRDEKNYLSSTKEEIKKASEERLALQKKLDIKSQECDETLKSSELKDRSHEETTNTLIQTLQDLNVNLEESKRKNMKTESVLEILKEKLAASLKRCKDNQNHVEELNSQLQEYDITPLQNQCSHLQNEQTELMTRNEANSMELFNIQSDISKALERLRKFKYDEKIYKNEHKIYLKLEKRSRVIEEEINQLKEALCRLQGNEHDKACEIHQLQNDKSTLTIKIHETDIELKKKEDAIHNLSLENENLDNEINELKINALSVQSKTNNNIEEDHRLYNALNDTLEEVSSCISKNESLIEDYKGKEDRLQDIMNIIEKRIEAFSSVQEQSTRQITEGKKELHRSLSRIEDEILSINIEYQKSQSLCAQIQEQKTTQESEFQIDTEKHRSISDALKEKWISMMNEELKNRDEKVLDLKSKGVELLKDLNDKKTEFLALKRKTKLSYQSMIKAKDLELNSYKENVNTLENEIKKLEKLKIDAKENQCGNDSARKNPRTFLGKKIFQKSSLTDNNNNTRRRKQQKDLLDS
ncbi:uncharacterized protein [Lepeophtheirus salmonis]|uniref:uncharacterized protein n=1 Tax=Lepeophtheirus salmonis TaxID=72036 RepID=UPI001AEB0E83|nr:putative leucine-rich repeat-containing protein DDB_G0290503 [Lepeophtheirus salmonis]